MDNVIGARRQQRNWPHFLVFASLVVLTVIALWPLQKRLNLKAEELRIDLVSRLELLTGREISYSGISPSLFRFLEIRDLEISGADGAPAVLAIRKLKIYYRIGDFLRGNPGDALTEFRLDNAVLTLDAAADAELIAKVSALMQTGRGFTLEEKTISSKNLALRYTSDLFDIEASSLYLNLTGEGEYSSVDFKGDTGIRWNSPAVFSKGSCGVEVDGVIGPQFGWTDLQAKFSDLTTDVFATSDLTLRIIFRDEILKLTKIQDNSPFDVSGTYSLSQKLAALSLNTHAFSVSDFITFNDTDSRLIPWLDTAVTGRGRVEYDLAAGSFSYEAQITSAIENAVLPFPVDITADFTGTNQSLKFTALTASTPHGNLEYSGRLDLAELAPSGILNLEALQIPGVGVGSGRFAVNRNGEAYEISGERFTMASLNIMNPRISIIPVEDDFEFLMHGDVFDGPNSGSFHLDGTLLSANEFLQISLNTADLPLAPFLKVLPSFSLPGDLENLLEAITLSSQLQFSSDTDFERFSFIAPRINLLRSDNSGEGISIRTLSGNSQQLAMENLTIGYGDTQVSGSLTFNYSDRDIFMMNCDLSYAGETYSLNGSFLPGKYLSVSGSHGIDGQAYWSPGGITFQFGARHLPLAWADFEPVKLDLDLKGRYSTRDDWSLFVHNTQATNLPYLPEDNALRFSAHLTPRKQTIAQIRYSDFLSTLTGHGATHIDFEQLSKADGWLKLSDLDGIERYELYFNISEESIAGIFDLGNSPLSRFGDLPLTGSFSGSGTVAGSKEKPELKGEFSLQEGFFQGNPVGMAFSVEAATDGINIRNLDGNYRSFTLADLNLDYDFPGGILDLDGRFETIFRQDTIATRFNARLSGAEMDWNAISSPGSMPLQGTIDLVDIRNGPEQLSPWTITLNTQDSGYLFSMDVLNFENQGPLEQAIRGSLASNGVVELTMRPELPFSAIGTGTITQGLLAVNLSEVNISMAALENLLQIPFFTMQSGKARGDLRLSGHIDNPEIWGTVQTTEIVAENAYVPVPLYLETPIHFQGNSIVIPDTLIDAGGTTVTARCDFLLDHFAPREYNIDLNIDPRQTLHIVSNFSRVEVDGWVSGDFSVRGDETQSVISGDIDVEKAIVFLGEKIDASRKPERRGRGQANLIIDNLVINTGKQVDFFWPSLSVPFLHAVASQGQQLFIDYNAVLDEMRLNGDVDVRSGEITWAQTDFHIKKGVIAFNETMDQIDPKVSAVAEIREIDENGKDVRIYITLENDSLSQFTPRLSSDPFKSEAEIIALLGADIFPLGDGREVSSALVLSELLSQMSFFRNIERQVRDALHLDLFSFRTQFLQTFVQDTFTPVDQVTAVPTLARYLDNTTLYLGKYFGNDIFLQGLLSFKDNAQWGLGGSNLGLESELSLEWQTPFFLIDLAFKPDFRDLIGSLPDTSLSLTWEYSY